MKKASKGAQGQGSIKQLKVIGNVFLTKRRSNMKVDYIPTGLEKTEQEY